MLFKPKTKYIYKLEIHDMRCGMCELHIEDTIRRAAKVKKVVANRFKNVATIYSNEAIDLNSVKKEIEKTGYEVLNIEKEEN